MLDVVYVKPDIFQEIMPLQLVHAETTRLAISTEPGLSVSSS